jgi:hypothetical protein
MREVPKPFPMPSVYTTTLTNKPLGGVGIHLQKKSGGFSPIIIVSLSDDSPLQGKAIKAGQTVLAINGVAIQSAKEALSIIRDAESTLVLTSCETCEFPQSKMIVVPSSKDNPGVNFTSTRGRCLVQVSRIFSEGPFAGTKLKKGDIVLAVNGVPVSKPEDADRALHLSMQLPHTTVYSIDVAQLRESILQVANSNFPHMLSIVPAEADNSYVVRYQHEKGTHLLVFDLETQHMLDSGGFGNWTMRINGKIIKPFVNDFNKIIESRMLPLEESVCIEAWKYLVPTPQEVHIVTEEVHIVTVASAPVENVPWAAVTQVSPEPSV